jgi:predicted HTH transcriptional regulator
VRFKKREDIIVNRMDIDLWVFGEVKMNESHRVEYKQTLTDSLEKEVVAFLNSNEGGSIYLGVSNDGKVIGLPNPDEIPPVFEIYSDRIEITSSGGLSTIKNRDDFFEGYSKPINRELMRVYKDLEMVEHLGSGLERILKAYGKESFKISQNFMKNIFYKSIVGVSGGVNKLLEFIKINPNFKANEISDNIQIPLRTVERWLKQLKDENKIEFRGGPKTGGYWSLDKK